MSTSPDPSIVRAEIRRRLAGVRYQLLLIDREEARSERKPRGKKRWIERDASGDADRAPQHEANRFSVVVAPRLLTGDIALVVRYSTAAGNWGLEFPGLDDQDEDDGWLKPTENSLAECGVISTGKKSILGVLHPNPSGSATSLLMIFADECQLGGAKASARDDAESPAGVVIVAPHVVGELARNGAIECSRTLVALQLLRSRVVGI
jgi:hypothetical protein